MCLKAGMDCVQHVFAGGDNGAACSALTSGPVHGPGGREVLTVPSDYDEEEEGLLTVSDIECCDGEDNSRTSNGFNQPPAPSDGEQTAAYKKLGAYKKHTMKMTLHNRVDINDLQCCSVTLWQFLLELLVNNKHPHLIQWTSRDGEFVLLQAEEVAKLWGTRKNNNHRMNYDKLSRALRYYYQKNIIKKVHGHKFVYRFICLPEAGLKSCQEAVTSRGGGAGVVERTSQQFVVKSEISPAFNNLSDDTPADSGRTDVKYPIQYPEMMQTIASTTSLNNTVSESTTGVLSSHRYSDLDMKQQALKLTPACCQCKCHINKSEAAKSGVHQLSSPPNDPSSDFLKASTESVFSLEALMHHSRHTINMQRLAQHLNFTGLRHDLLQDCETAPTQASHKSPTHPAAAKTSNSLTYQQQHRKRSASTAGFLPPQPSDESVKSPLEHLSSYRNHGFLPSSVMPPLLAPTSHGGISSYSQPTIPSPVQAVQSNLFLPPAIPASGGSAGSCIWMPVPVSMLNHWWQAGYPSGLTSQTEQQP